MRKASYYLLALLLTVSTLLAGDARKVDRILNELANDPPPEGKYQLLEKDLNAYLARELERNPDQGLEDISVKLNGETFTTFLRVNMDELELRQDSMTASLFKTLLQGTQDVEVEGELIVQNGVGTYSTRSARINRIPVPASAVDMILSSLGRQQEPPLDPTRPFGMPANIERLTFDPGQVTIHTRSRVKDR